MLTRRQTRSSKGVSVDVGSSPNENKRKSIGSPSPRKVSMKRSCNDINKNAVEPKFKSEPNLESKLKSKSDQKSVPKSQPRKSQPNGIRPYTEKTSEAHACCNAIEHVFAIKYVNVVERLKLTFPAKCTQSLMECRQEHTRNEYMDMSNSTVTSQTFLKNHQPLMFIHVISMDVLEGTFPGRQAIQTLFELLLCINEPSTGEYDAQHVINMASFTISNILEKFPPCWLAANKQYRTLLNTKVKYLICDSNEFLNTRTLFEDLMFCIEHVIQIPAKRLPVAASAPTSAPDEPAFLDNSLFNDPIFNDSQDLQCFSTWELKNVQKYSFDSLSRDEKIDRAFVSLGIFVQLFEMDLAMWTIKNIRNPSGKMFDSQKGPLIGSVLWSNNEPHQVNYCIKNILKLYVNYISIDFPSEHTNILTRLVNIIFTVFDLSDFPSHNDHDDRIDYPQSAEKQSYFCDAFTKTIFDNNGSNVELWLKVIQTVAHPRLKLYLINALLTKIEHKKIALNPKTIYNSLCELEKQFDDIFDKTNSQNNNIVQTKHVNLNAVDTTPTYPHLQKINRRAASDLSYEQHAKLHLVALRAYMDIFHIDEFKEYWKNYDKNEADRKKAIEQYKADMEAFKNETIKPFDIDEMKKLQRKSLDARIKMSNARIYSLDVMNEAVGLHFLPQIDVKKYRNDAKYVDLIATGLPKLHTKLGQLFPNPK